LETVSVSLGVAVRPTWVALEVSEDVAPSGVFIGAAPVALVHHDEVEEVGAELLVDVGRSCNAADGLVQRQVNLVAFVHLLGGFVDRQVYVVHFQLALRVDALNAFGVG
jgi:hypothetical protein